MPVLVTVRICVCQVLEEEEYEVWMKRQLQAESSIENREELLQDSAQRLETQLTLLGVFWECWGGQSVGVLGAHIHPPPLSRLPAGTTGIVDRLQEQVPETLLALQKAGIRVWVLTGDKKETALNIANAAKLLGPQDTVLTATGGSKVAQTANTTLKIKTSVFLFNMYESRKHFAAILEKKTIYINISL